MQNTQNTQSHWNLIQDGSQQYLLRKISNTPLSNIEYFIQRLQLCKHKSIAIPELVRLSDGDIYFKEKRGPKTLEQFLQTQPSTQAKLFLLHQLSKALDNLHTFVGMPHGNLTTQCISITESGDMLLGGLDCNKNKQEVDTADLHKIIATMLHLPEEQILVQRLQGLQPFRVRSELQNLLADDNWEAIVSSWKSAVQQTSNEESSEDIEDVKMTDISLALLQEENASIPSPEESATPVSIDTSVAPKFSDNTTHLSYEEFTTSTTDDTVAIVSEEDMEEDIDFEADDFDLIIEELPAPAKIRLEKTPAPNTDSVHTSSVPTDTSPIASTMSTLIGLDDMDDMDEMDEMDDATEAFPNSATVTSAIQLEKKPRNTDIFANLFSTDNDLSHDFTHEGTEDLESIEDASAEIYSIDDIPEYPSMEEIQPPTSPKPILQNTDIGDQYLDSWMQTPAKPKSTRASPPNFLQRNKFWMITGMGVAASLGIYVQSNTPPPIDKESISQSKEKLSKALQQMPVVQVAQVATAPVQEVAQPESVESTVDPINVEPMNVDPINLVSQAPTTQTPPIPPIESSVQTEQPTPKKETTPRKTTAVQTVEDKISSTKKQQTSAPKTTSSATTKTEPKKSEKIVVAPVPKQSVTKQEPTQEKSATKEKPSSQANSTTSSTKPENKTKKDATTTTLVVPTTSNTVVSTTMSTMDTAVLVDNLPTQNTQSNLDLRGAENQVMVVPETVESVLPTQRQQVNSSTQMAETIETLPKLENVENSEAIEPIVAMATQTERQAQTEKQQKQSSETPTEKNDTTEEISVEPTDLPHTTVENPPTPSKTKTVASSPNWDDVSRLAINGHIDTRTLEQIRAVERTDPDFTRVNAIALTYGQQSNDISVIQESLTKILSLEQNQKQPIYLLAMAQHQFNSKNFDETREYLLQAEKNWGNVDRDHLASLRLQRDNIVAHMSYVTYMQNGKEDSRIQSLMQFRKVQRNAQKTVKDSVFKVAQEKIVILQQFAPGNTSDNSDNGETP